MTRESSIVLRQRSQCRSPIDWDGARATPQPKRPPPQESSTYAAPRLERPLRFRALDMFVIGIPTTVRNDSFEAIARVVQQRARVVRDLSVRVFPELALGVLRPVHGVVIAREINAQAVGLGDTRVRTARL